MAISMTLGVAAYSNVDASSYTTASFSPAGGDLLMAFMMMASTNPGVPNVGSMTGFGLTWSEVAERAFSGSGALVRRIAVWKAQCGASPGTDSVAINHTDEGDGPSTGTGWNIIRVSGHDEAAPIVGTPLEDNASSGTSATVTLASPANSENRALVGFMHRANEGKTPRANWTELADVFGGNPSIGLETQWRSDTYETTASATWTTSNPWAYIACEIAVAQPKGIPLRRSIPILGR